jgi:hypothetical protein
MVRDPAGPYRDAHRTLRTKEHIMGKYVLAWALGVPGIIIVIAYLLFH